MTWRDKYQAASFRGVAFSVESADGTHGRRTQAHQYPLRNKPFVEDLGRSDRVFVFEALVIGADYMTGRDALINAIEQPGPGTLVHPYYGTMQCSVTSDGHVKESTREGGMARFTLTFTESGDFIYPSATNDTASTSSNQAQTTEADGSTSFASLFSVLSLPAFVAASAVATINRLLTTVGNLALFPNADPIARAALGAAVGALSSGASTQVQTPATLAASIVGVVQALSAAAPDPVSAVGALAQLAAFTVPTLPPPLTSTRVTQVNNQAALVSLVQVVAASEAANALSTVDFTSSNQAMQLRDSVTCPIDALMDVTTDDAVYADLCDLRAAVVDDVTTRGANLATIVQYTPIATLPALVISYMLYNDPSQEADIVARNNPAHPGFIPAGIPIEVLIDA